MSGFHDFDPKRRDRELRQAAGAAEGSEAPGPENSMRDVDLDLDLDLDLPGEVAARRRAAESARRASGQDPLRAQGAAGDADAAASSGSEGPAAGVPAPDSNATGAAESGPNAGPAGGAAAASGGQDLAAQAEHWRSVAEQNREKWLRAMAELENFRKRTRREMESSILFANANLLRELLEILDNFERALGAPPSEGGGSGDAMAQGVRLIYERFREILQQNGVVRIEALDVPFDPNLHEAILQVEKDGVPSHQVVEVAQAGYMLREIVLRPARVVVAK